MNHRLHSLLVVALLATGIAADETHWAFQPVQRTTPPATHADDSSRNAIDRFIAGRLEHAGFAPSPEADRHTLIRRVTLDLIGLPPTPDEVAEFVNDTSPDAYERLVDRLLASPHYGEHWTRQWLDLCHYGDSDGHLTDQLRPVAWRYRDWVLHALNENMPFDEFTRLQLAGDLVAAERETATLQDAVAADRLDAWLGTGFLRQTLSNREGGADLEEYRVEQVVDRTSLVGSIWLGLTVGCARCHDHKYDPLTQYEFYQLFAYFDQADEINIDAPLPQEREAYLHMRPEYVRQRRKLEARYQPGLDELQQRWETKLLYAWTHPGEDHVWDRQWEVLGLIWGGGLGEGQLEGTEICKLPWDQRTGRQQDDLRDYFLKNGAIVDGDAFSNLKLADLQSELDALKTALAGAAPTRAPVMRTMLTPRTTAVHEAGDFRVTGLVVAPETPAWLPASDAEKPPRLVLANWLISPVNPLTPRVTANRAWQSFFGRGLVATADDFGLRGDPPTHPALLDWQASELVRGEWDMKRLHRLIVTSATYRQSSQPRPELATIDPGNALLARQSSLRVPAEVVRDSALAVSGLAEQRLGGPCVFPPQSERVTMEAFGYNGWPVSTGADRYRRGLYTFTLRTSPFAQSIIFDAPAPVAACTRRDRSNTPLQALTLLNDAVFVEMAESLGKRIAAEPGGNDSERIGFAMELCLSRPAMSAEVARLQAYVDEQRSAAVDEAQLWGDVAAIVLNLHEFITRD
ncbi:MAG: DUF1553 domain-containing protein [Planctomycetaceae bacterium]|nr:DUF1553 domain-containing protein [Planctomycetaceae bacterium]